MHTRLLDVSPEAIQTSGDWLFNLRGPDPALDASLEHAGQLTPLLAAEEEGGLVLVDGLKRLRRLRDGGHRVQVALVEAPADLDRAMLRLQANRAWDLAEQDPARLATVLRFFLQRLSLQQTEAQLAPLLGLAPRGKTWRLLRCWCRNMDADSPWERHLLEGRAPLAAAEALARLEPDQLQALEPFFCRLSWSASAGRELPTLLFETVRRTGRPLPALLQESGMLETLEAGHSPKDAMTRLLQAARALRFPERTALDRRFAELAGRLTRGSGWRVQPEVQYEADALYLQAKVQDAGEAAKLAAALQDMAGSPLLEELCTLGRERRGGA